MKNPCRDCKDRHAGCHTKDCPHGWYEWDIAHKEQRQRIWQEKQNQYRASDYNQLYRKNKGGA